MGEDTDLYLHEEVLLLALGRDGQAASGSLYRYALGGAVLAELLLHDRVKVEGAGWRKRLQLVSATQIGEPVLDRALERMREARRAASPGTWLSRFAGIAKTGAVARRLRERGLLRYEERRFLLVIPRAAYPLRGPEAAAPTVEALRRVIFSDDREPDERTRALLALARAANLLERVFGKRELKGREDRLRALTRGQPAGAATRAVLRRVSLAVAVGGVGGVILAALLGA